MLLTDVVVANCASTTVLCGERPISDPQGGTYLVSPDVGGWELYAYHGSGTIVNILWVDGHVTGENRDAMGIDHSAF